MTNISNATAASIINKIDDEFFTVTFVKRTTGEERTMNCRKGVVKHTKGGTLGYNPKAKNLMSVYDMQSAGYRMINLNDIKALTVNKQHFVVV